MSKLEQKKTRHLKLKNTINKKRLKFKRQECWRYKRLKPNWRKPGGIDNRVRMKEKGVIKSPNVGYRGPRLVRGLRSDGREEVLVHNIKDLEGINPKKQVIRIARTVGILKRTMIINKAGEKDILVLNPGKALLKEKPLVDIKSIEKD